MARTDLNFRQFASGVIVPIIIIVVAVGGYFAVWPKYRALGSDKEELAAKKEELAANQKTLTNLKSLVEDYAKKKDAAAVVSNVIPTAPEIPELLANLDYLTKQSGISITNIRITLPKVLKTGEAVIPDELARSTENLAIMQIDLGLSGKYLNIKTFLLNLEQNGRLMDVKDLNFQQVDEQTKIQGFTLKIRTYYQKS